MLSRYVIGIAGGIGILSCVEEAQRIAVDFIKKRKNPPVVEETSIERKDGCG